MTTIATMTPERQLRAAQHPHNWSLPSKPRRISKTLPSAPDPRVFCDALISYPVKQGNQYLPTLKQYPTRGHVAVHLCLIECFVKLKQQVEDAIAVANIDLSKYHDEDSLPSYAEDAARWCENSLSPQWRIFLRIANRRYERWFEHLEGIIRHAAAFNRYGTGSHLHGAFTEHYLPPLDVLYIWHLHLLRPDRYLEQCRLNGFQKSLDICFPWDALIKAIDLGKMDYQLSDAAQKLFENFTGLPSDWRASMEFSKDDESPITNFQLVDIQDTIFTERMHDLLWIRSPSLEGTIDRGASTYGKLMKRSHTSTSSIGHHLLTDPSFELLWRTHKLYPAAYTCFVNRTPFSPLNACLPDCKNKVGLESLPDEVPMQDEEPSCYCWICERLRDAGTDHLTDKDLLHSPVQIASKLSSRDIQAVKLDLMVYRYLESRREANAIGPSPPSYRKVKAKKLREKITLNTKGS